MKNWKTTVAGLLAALPQLLLALGIFPANSPIANLISAASLVVMGLVAKDHNVTGGDTPQ